MTELQTVNPKEFDCGGKKWVMCNTPSFARYTKLQEIAIEFAYSCTISDLFKTLEQAKDCMNKLKLADAAVHIHNAQRGIADIDAKHPAAFRMCALFINTQGEDLTDASDEMINAKINIWAKELDSSPFFHLAASIQREWIAAFNVYSQSISAKG